MAASFIQLPPDSTGKKLSTQTDAAGAHMEVHVLADADGTLAQVSGLAKDATLTSGAQKTQVTAGPANGAASGTLTAAGQAVTLTVPDGHSSWSITLGGTFSAASQVAFEFSEDNTNWYAANGRRNLDINTNDTTSLLDANPMGGPAPLGASPSHWRGSAGGVKYLRVRCSIFTASDAIAVTINTSTGVGTTFLNSPTPPVANYAASGSLTALNDAVTIPCLGMSGYSAVVTGTWTGTLTLEATVDGTTWNPVNGAVQGVGTLSTTITANTQVRGTLGGLKQFRVRLSTVGSGTAAVAVTAGAGAAGFFLMAPPPAPNGTFGYTAGASGTVSSASGRKVQQITAHATTAGTLTINGGPAIPIPAANGFSASYADGKLTDPTLVFTGTDSYYVDWLA